MECGEHRLRLGLIRLSAEGTRDRGRMTRVLHRRGECVRQRFASKSVNLSD